MREEIARLVYPVVLHALGLKERLARGAAPVLEVEQATLRALLLSDAEARRWPVYSGDEPAQSSRPANGSEAAPRRPFLGLRYALACWVDELLIRYTAWEAVWNENKLEMALYGTNDRAWKFWEQVAEAQGRLSPGMSEAPEGFYLLVMLGFRGELAAEPAKLDTWVASCRPQVLRGLGRPWVAPPRLEPPTAVPPLRQRQRLRRAVLAGGLLLLLIVPLLAHFLVRQLGH